MLSWIIACLAVVPLSLAAYAANVHHLRWLPPSAQDRLVIWKATSDLIRNASVLGVGVHSGRVITRAEVERPKAPGTPYALSVGWHSHNAFLQVWFETGPVGAGLLLCFGLLAFAQHWRAGRRGAACAVCHVCHLYDDRIGRLQCFRAVAGCIFRGLRIVRGSGDSPGRG